MQANLQSRRDFFSERSVKCIVKCLATILRTVERKNVLPRGWMIGKRKDRERGGVKKHLAPLSNMAV